MTIKAPSQMFHWVIYKPPKESSESRGVFRTQSSIYDGGFLWTYLTAYYFCNKGSIADVHKFEMRGYIPSKGINVESTLKQRWSSTFINVASTLIFSWKWKLSWHTFFNVVSALAKQRWSNVDRITLIQRR